MNLIPVKKLFSESIQKFTLRHFLHHFPLPDQRPSPFPPAIPISAFSLRQVLPRAHDRNFDIQWNIFYHIFNFVCKTDQIDLCASTGWT